MVSIDLELKFIVCSLAAPGIFQDKKGGNKLSYQARLFPRFHEAVEQGVTNSHPDFVFRQTSKVFETFEV